MNQTILYLECNSGISGDMTVGALLDLGADRQVLEAGLASLPLDGYSIQISEVFKSGLRACDFNVILTPELDNHDHDMAYLHGEAHTHSTHQQHYKESGDASHTHDQAENVAHHSIHSHGNDTACCSHTHDSDSDHHHSHSHGNDTTCCSHTHGSDADYHHSHSHSKGDTHPAHDHHHHTARNLQDIITILNQGAMTENARSLAIRIFTILAEAEASVHGKPVDQVHFHEVGAIDSIVDIAAAAICIDNLHPDQVIVSALSDGTGQIRCQHGLIPVPVPAVSAIAAAQKLTLKIRPVEGELVTPTGAAIAAALRTGEELPDEFRILRTGLGAGKRDYPTTGVLRAMLLEPVTQQKEHSILMLQTNIDDCTGEALSFTLEQLMNAGALDVYYTPVYMKKNRPAWLLTVLCTHEQRPCMEHIIFRNTTTIGIRALEVNRTRLDREIHTIETPWGTADIKCCTWKDETYFYPENDSVSRLAKQADVGFTEMYHKVQEIAQRLLSE